MTKPLHRQFLRQTQQIADSKSWARLTTGGLNKETKGFLMAAQDQALWTNAAGKYANIISDIYLKTLGKSYCQHLKSIADIIARYINTAILTTMHHGQQELAVTTPCPEKNGTNNVLGITLANTNI